MNRKLVLAFGCFVKAGVYGGIALFSFVLLIEPEMASILIQTVTNEEVIPKLIPKYILKLTVIVSILESLMNIAEIPENLK